MEINDDMTENSHFWTGHTAQQHHTTEETTYKDISLFKPMFLKVWTRRNLNQNAQRVCFKCSPFQHLVELKALGVHGDMCIFNQQIQVIYMHTKF